MHPAQPHTVRASSETFCCQSYLITATSSWLATSTVLARTLMSCPMQQGGAGLAISRVFSLWRTTLDLWMLGGSSIPESGRSHTPVLLTRLGPDTTDGLSPQISYIMSGTHTSGWGCQAITWVWWSPSTHRLASQEDQPLEHSPCSCWMTLSTGQS